jgi:hypothetical protein
MSVPYYLVGQILDNSAVLLCTTVQNKLYFCTLNNGKLIFDPRSPLLNGGPVPTIFTADVNNNSNNRTISFKINDSVNPNFNIDNSGFAIAGTSTPITMFPTATDLNVQYAAVAGAEYSFNYNSSKVKFRAYTPKSEGSTESVFSEDIKLDSDGNAILQTFSSFIRILPIKYYFLQNCNSSPTNTSAVVLNEAEWVSKNVFETGTFLKGFTVQSECNNNVFYEYCILPATCGGGNNCNGVCPNNAKCTLNKSTGQFGCNNKTLGTNMWWILWIVLGVLVLILLIWIIYYAFSSSRKGASVVQKETIYKPKNAGPIEQIYTTTTPGLRSEFIDSDIGLFDDSSVLYGPY